MDFAPTAEQRLLSAALRAFIGRDLLRPHER